jgi:hypothetical protein
MKAPCHYAPRTQYEGSLSLHTCFSQPPTPTQHPGSPKESHNLSNVQWFMCTKEFKGGGGGGGGNVCKCELLAWCRGWVPGNNQSHTENTCFSETECFVWRASGCLHILLSSPSDCLHPTVFPKLLNRWSYCKIYILQTSSADLEVQLTLWAEVAKQNTL